MNEMFPTKNHYVFWQGKGGWYYRRVGSDLVRGPWPTQTDAEDRAAASELQQLVEAGTLQ